MSGYKAGNISRVVQNPYNSVQKLKLYAILMIVFDFEELPNFMTYSQYAEMIVLCIKTAELIPDNSELTLLFVQLQQTI